MSTTDRSLENILVVMGHTDIYHITNLRNQGESRVVSTHWLPRLRDSGQSVVFAAISGDQQSHLNGSRRPLFASLEQWEMFLEEIAEAGPAAKIVRNSDDLPKAHDPDCTYFVLGLEGGKPLEHSIKTFRVFYRLGMRIFQITHDLRNELADGRLENVTGGGLSRFGKAVVEEANRLGVLLDVSHIGDSSFYDVLNTSKSPVVATHANVRSVHDHPRNFTDEQIRMLADSGGMLNLIYIPRFIGQGIEPVEGIMNHLRYVVDLVGVEHVGIGGLGTDSDEMQMFQNAGWPYERLAHVLAERPSNINTAEQIKKMTDALVREGLTDEEVRAIFGGNLMRILSGVLSEGNDDASAG